MKLTTLITAASSVTAIAFAGEPAPAPMAPAPSGSCWDGWFFGATYGQFDTDYSGDVFGRDDDSEFSDVEFDMFTLHVGRDLDAQFLGCDLAAYLEIGIMDGEMTVSEFDSQDVLDDRYTLDFEIVPITLNLKAEREFFAGVKGYITAGIGYAFSQVGDADVSFGDGGFYAQASIGLAYDINQNWEIFGGARWVHLSSLDFGLGDEIELDDAIAWEVGLRYNF
jgi:opacity protein-like surface antigen